MRRLFELAQPSRPTRGRKLKSKAARDLPPAKLKEKPWNP
jgi:hypothetical protein